MQNDTVTTLSFQDRDSRDEGLVIIRVVRGTVGLTVSLKSNGDAAIYVGPDEAATIAAKLQEASKLAAASWTGPR